jgi:hypothetical protein
MVTRYTTNGDGAAVQDPGRVNSERIIERGNTKKWLEAMKADADKEVAFALRKLKYVVPVSHRAGVCGRG